MTSARHDQHRCRLRVRPSRYGQALPIVRSEVLHHLAIEQLRLPFDTATTIKALLGTPRRSKLMHDQPLPTEATT